MLDLLHQQLSHAFALSRRAGAGCTIGQMVPPMPDAGVGALFAKKKPIILYYYIILYYIILYYIILY